MKDPKETGRKPPFKGEREQPFPGHEQEMKHKPDHGEKSYKGYGRLEGKKAVITGADSGIGRAVALAFAREGADVAIAYLEEDKDAQETRRWVEDAGRRAVMIKENLMDSTACRSVIETARRELGGVDILVNNAAFQGKAIESLEELDEERLHRTFATNIVSLFHLARNAVPHMKSGSTIINTASVEAFQPEFALLDYASTKGAIVSFTKALGKKLIEKGIRVNAVAPGPVWTPLIPQSFPEQKVEKFGGKFPMNRPAQPAEMAPAYVFLACEESRYINGEILNATGGVPLP